MKSDIMDFKFGKRSLENYYTLHPDLQKVAFTALKLGIIDFSIICGHRGEEEQNKYFNSKKSKVKYPNSKHNSFPSRAMDLVPYINWTISWNNLHCCILAGMILATAKTLGTKLRWGGNWDCDSEPITDQDFQDLCHFELI